MALIKTGGLHKIITETQDFDDNNNPERHEIAVVDNKDNSVRSEI